MANILLIEPDPIMAKNYLAILKSANNRVTVIKSAQAAINIADQNKPDLVFLEVQLSEHNGLEFLYEFRSYPEWQTIPVVLLSAVPLSDIAEDVGKLKELGVVDYLYKPSTKLEHITRVVDRFVTQPS